jgi:hypothetical protein
LGEGLGEKEKGRKGEKEEGEKGEKEKRRKGESTKARNNSIRTFVLSCICALYAIAGHMSGRELDTQTPSSICEVLIFY